MPGPAQHTHTHTHTHIPTLRGLHHVSLIICLPEHHSSTQEKKNTHTHTHSHTHTHTHTHQSTITNTPTHTHTTTHTHKHACIRHTAVTDGVIFDTCCHFYCVEYNQRI